MRSSIAIIVAIVSSLPNAAESGGSSAGLDANAIVSIAGAIVSVICAVTSYFLGTKKMYVDIVIKDRLKAIEERRNALKDLYYYTNPSTIDCAANAGEKRAHIQSLLKLQSILEHRLMGELYPEKDILCLTQALIALAIKYIKTGTKDENYDKTRSNCLRLLKIYNFASWNFAQKHSTGRKGSSIHGFDDAFVEALQSLTQESETIDKTKKLLKSRGIDCDIEEQVNSP